MSLTNLVSSRYHRILINLEEKREYIILLQVDQQQQQQQYLVMYQNMLLQIQTHCFNVEPFSEQTRNFYNIF